MDQTSERLLENAKTKAETLRYLLHLNSRENSEDHGKSDKFRGIYPKVSETR